MKYQIGTDLTPPSPDPSDAGLCDRQPKVAQTLERLKTATDHLRGKADSLLKRIEPVLSPDMVNPTESKGQCEPKPGVPVCDIVMACVQELDATARRIDLALKRLEL